MELELRKLLAPIPRHSSLTHASFLQANQKSCHYSKFCPGLKTSLCSFFSLYLITGENSSLLQQETGCSIAEAGRDCLPDILSQQGPTFSSRSATNEPHTPKWFSKPMNDSCPRRPGEHGGRQECGTGSAAVVSGGAPADAASTVVWGRGWRSCHCQLPTRITDHLQMLPVVGW